MYYITKIDSETGKKFQALKEKRQVIFDKQKVLSKKYGFSQWIEAPFLIAGSIECVFFEEETKIDPKIWKLYNTYDGENFYAPKLNSKVGKEIKQDFESFEKISWNDLNACVGADMFAKCIGFAWGKDYFGFTTKEEWALEIPADCQEITYTKWKEIFKI